MILALATVGWGLFAAGAVSHAMHFDRLVELLSLHRRNPGRLARLLVGVEVAIVVVTAASLVADLRAVLVVTAIFGALLGCAFTIWVVRLLVSGSTLPCACSFSAGPTTRWSVARAAATIFIALFALTPSGVSLGEIVTGLVVGAAAGWAGFLLPDALSWPEESLRLRDLVRSPAGPGSTTSSAATRSS